MNRFRDPNWALILLFVGMIGITPLVQTTLELFEDDGVIALELFGNWPTAHNLRSFENKLEKSSWAGRVSRPWLQFANFRALKEGGEKVVIGLDGWYFFRPGLKYMLDRHDSARTAHGTNDPVPAIIDFRNQLAERGIKLLVMPVPNKESIYPDRLSPNANIPSGVLSSRSQAVLQRLRASNIEVVDLFEAFLNARRTNSITPAAPLYLAQDTHWSPAGVKLAAGAVARRLSDLGWISQGNMEYHENAARVERLGDILRMLQAPMIERTLNPETVPAVQVVRGETGAPYQDEASAEILVIGDSFMRIFQQDAPMSAGFIAHLAKELKQPLMSVVNDGGGATLVREEVCSRPVFLDKKKVVIWEFVERDIGLAVKGWPRTPLPKLGTNLAVKNQEQTL